MTTVVLTRPQADSERLSQALQSEGFQTRVTPIMTIEAISTAEQAPAPSLSDDAPVSYTHLTLPTILRV